MDAEFPRRENCLGHSVWATLRIVGFRHPDYTPWRVYGFDGALLCPPSQRPHNAAALDDGDCWVENLDQCLV